MGWHESICTGCSRWPVREYAWGKAPVLASATSDVLKLRDLLLFEGFDNFKRATEASYHTFRWPKADRVASCQAA